jgi:Lrp/AsnC family transcriptional regulator for asnA, asnC and gidA
MKFVILLYKYYDSITKKNMDHIDFEIIAALQKDGRKPFTEIARSMGLTEGTIRNRARKLMECGVIQVIGLADPNQLGFEAPAMIGLTVQPAFLDNAAAQIAQLPEVSYLIMVSGEFDLMVEVMCRDRNHLTEFLNQKLYRLEGIQQSKIFQILKTYKMAYGALPTPPSPDE